MPPSPPRVIHDGSPKRAWKRRSGREPHGGPGSDKNSIFNSMTPAILHGELLRIKRF